MSKEKDYRKRYHFYVINHKKLNIGATFIWE